MSKGGAGKVYFVLYLAVILELLIIIVERDEAEEHLIRKQKEAEEIVIETPVIPTKIKKPQLNFSLKLEDVSFLSELENEIRDSVEEFIPNLLINQITIQPASDNEEDKGTYIN